VEEEIDLRQYIEVLLKRWHWIVILGGLAAVVAFIISAFLPPIYQAEAQVLILKSSTDVSFEPSIRDQNQNAQNAPALRDDQQTLVSLVKSNDVALAVLNEVANNIPVEVQETTTLLKKVSASNNANLITISLQDQDPALAALLADAWAGAYERYVNKLFNGQNDVYLSEVEAQAVELTASYQQAQVTLEQFLSQNEIAQIERDIIDLDQQLDTKYALLATQFSVDHDILRNKYNELKRIDIWLDDAEIIQDQLRADPTSAGANLGNLVALINLKGQSSSGDPNPIRLQLNVIESEGIAATAADVSTIMTALEDHQSRIEADIATLTAQLIQGDGQTGDIPRGSEILTAIEPIIEQKLALEAALEIQKAQERELIATRDLAWENHQAMQRKLAEVRLDAQITDSQVRLAAHAAVPQDPIAPRRLLNTAMAGMLGVFLAIVAIYAVEYWQSSDISPEQAPSTNPETASTLRRK